jgi:hypothetical protein
MLFADMFNNYTFTVLRIIRLGRVVRALKLGKYMESFVILYNTVARSVKALAVLVFYLLLGVCVFASLMYIVEIGKWNEATMSYQILKSEWTNHTSGEVVLNFVDSRFHSIPAAMWFAIVTATTLGFGDVVPLTPQGKVTAGVTMVWGILMVSIPVSVLSTNFRRAWKEFVDESLLRQKDEDRTLESLNSIMATRDMTVVQHTLKISVWDDDGRGRDGDFLGCCESVLDFGRGPPPERGVLTVPLKPDYDIAKRPVTGTVTFEYVWTPEATEFEYPPEGNHDDMAATQELESSRPLLGDLTIIIKSANDLLNMDWKGESDPFCRVLSAAARF